MGLSPLSRTDRARRVCERRCQARPNIGHRFAVRVLFGVATAIETPSSLTLPCRAFGVDDRRGEVRLRPEFIDHDFPQASATSVDTPGVFASSRWSRTSLTIRPVAKP